MEAIDGSYPLGFLRQEFEIRIRLHVFRRVGVSVLQQIVGISIIPYNFIAPLVIIITP